MCIKKQIEAKLVKIAIVHKLTFSFSQWFGLGWLFVLVCSDQYRPVLSGSYDIAGSVQSGRTSVSKVRSYTIKKGHHLTKCRSACSSCELTQINCCVQGRLKEYGVSSCENADKFERNFLALWPDRQAAGMHD